MEKFDAIRWCRLLQEWIPGRAFRDEQFICGWIGASCLVRESPTKIQSRVKVEWRHPIWTRIEHIQARIAVRTILRCTPLPRPALLRVHIKLLDVYRCHAWASVVELQRHTDSPNSGRTATKFQHLAPAMSPSPLKLLGQHSRVVTAGFQFLSPTMSMSRTRLMATTPLLQPIPPRW